MGLLLEVGREDDSQVFVGVYDVDVFFINRQRELLTCVHGTVAERKNNSFGRRETASPEPKKMQATRLSGDCAFLAE